MKSRAKILAEKSVSAMLSAVEIYNKPDFKHREETFSILGVNAWELLLKARLLQLSENKVSAILQYKKRTNRDGKLSAKEYRVPNRSGNYNTIGIFKAFDILTNEYGDSLNNIIRTNIEALVEVRDNSVHFINKDFNLSKKVHEIGTASIKNYIRLINLWFGIDFTQYDIFLMPIGFIRNISAANTVLPSMEERRLIEFIRSTERKVENDPTSDYSFTLNIDIQFRKAKPSSDGTGVSVTNRKDVPEVRLSEEDIMDKFPWDYKILTTRLRKRYSNFKVSQQYHKMRKLLSNDPKYCHVRLLDPGNPKSSTKQFFNPDIIKEFDKQYTVKKQAAESLDGE